MNGVYSSETLMRDLAKCVLCMCERLEAALGDMVLIPTMLRSFYSHFTKLCDWKSVKSLVLGTKTGGLFITSSL